MKKKGDETEGGRDSIRGEGGGGSRMEKQGGWTGVRKTRGSLTSPFPAETPTV